MTYTRTHTFTVNKGTIGIEIINNTPETIDLQFLGMEHRHFMKKGVTIRSIFDETLYDDGNLLQLNDWLLSVGRVHITCMTFTTSLLYEQFNNKVFIANHREYNGTLRFHQWQLENYFSAYKFQPQVVQIPEVFIMNFYSSFKQTNIHAGERFVVIFHMGRESEAKYGELITKMNNTFNRNNQKKILLITS